MIRPSAAFTAFVIYSAANLSAAQPYQFELSGGVLQAETSSSLFTQTIEVDSQTIDGRFYLRPVNATGPLAERAFLDKAASIGLTYVTAEPENGDSTDSFGANARFVTQSNTIFDLSYLQTELPEDETLDVYSLGVGKYLDDRTTLVGTFGRTDNTGLTLDIVSGIYRKVDSTQSGASYMAQASLSFIQVSDDFGFDETGFGTSFMLMYYPSDKLGVGGSLVMQDIDDVDDRTLGLEIEYFVSEAVSVTGAIRRQTQVSEIDIDTLLLFGLLRF